MSYNLTEYYYIAADQYVIENRSYRKPELHRLQEWDKDHRNVIYLTDKSI